MKNKLFLLINLLLIGIFSFGQNCLPEGITFNDQSQIDNFRLDYPDCTIIQGTVKLKSQFCINNLDSLIGIQEIQGDLIANNSYNIDDFNGLDSLKKITGSLIVYNASDFSSFSGLNNLKEIGGDFEFILNSKVSSFAGLENLSVIGGKFDVSSTQIISFNGLGQIDSIGGTLKIDRNWKLKSISDFNSLTYQGGEIFIDDNEILESLKGFDKLTSVNSNVQISNCNNIDSLEILNSIVEIKGDFNVNNCSKLKYIGPLHGLKKIQGDLHFEKTSLKGLSFFLGLEFIGGSLNLLNEDFSSLHGLDSLSSLGGLKFYKLNMPSFEEIKKVDSIHGSFEIRNCSVINSFNEVFETLKYINGDLKIFGCSDLNVFSNAFANLNTVNGNIELEYLNKVIQIDDFPILQNVSGFISINNNANLNNIVSFGDSLEHVWYIHIYNNNELGTIQLPFSLDSLTTLAIVDNPKLVSLGQPTSIKKIKSNLSLNGNTSLVNLDAMNSLKSVGKYCYIIECHSLENMQGFKNLKTVKNLTINFNDSLESLSGLDSLENVLEEFEISNNINLKTLSGIESLRKVNGTFEIQGNDKLENLDGLQNFEEVDKFILYDNIILKSIHEIENIISIQHFRISDMDSLVFDFVFNNLSSIKVISVIGMPKISDLSAFNNLQKISEGLVLASNASLQSIEALQDVNIEDLEYLSISYNEKLSFCPYNNICSYIGSGGNTQIIDNQGCENLEEILFYCFEPECSTIIAPVDSAELDPYDIEIEWEENPFISEYTIVLGTCPTCSDIDSTIVSATNYNIPFLNPYKSYYLRILTENDVGISQDCASTYFTTGAGIDCGFAKDTFFTQSEIDSFKIMYGHCSNIIDSLILYSEEILNIDSFSNLINIKYLEINSTNIKNLEGFKNLLTVDEVVIKNNSQLKDITDLNIDLKLKDSVTILGNKELEFCHIIPLCKFLINQGSALITDNSENCSSKEDIIPGCYECSSIIYPIDSSEVDPINIEVEWEKNPYTLKHTLIIGTCPTCNDIDSSIVAGPSHTIPILNPFGEYYVRILTDNDYGFAQDCESVFFTTGTGQDCGFAKDTFFTQSEIDSFNKLYGHCENIYDSLIIFSNSIINLDSLSNLKNINYLEINNTNVIDLKGLNSLKTINEFVIKNNSKLNDLSSLDINFEIKESLTILHNTDLSACQINSICNFLIEIGNAEIADNLEGCTSIPEVISSCFVSNKDYKELDCVIFPNPASTHFKIESTSTIKRLIIYNINGQVIKIKSVDRTEIMIQDLEKGMYFIKIEIKDKVFYRKVVVD